MRFLDRRILNLSLPAVVATITTPLLGLTDTAFTGHMGGASYLAAIALGSNVLNLLFWLFTFLRSGTSGITAQARGRGSHEDMLLSLIRSTGVAVVAGLLLIIFQTPILYIFGLFMKAEPLAWEQCGLYFRILVWGAPASLATFAISGWFIGMASSKSAMWMSILIDLVNIALSCLLVLGVGMKVEGVALGSLVAQYVGVFFAFLLARRLLPKGIGLDRSRIFDPKELSRFFSVNFDIFLRNLCIIVVTLWFTRSGSVQGTVMLAANSLLMQFFLLFSYFIDGLAYAAEALIGEATGARVHIRRRYMVRRLMLWGTVLATLFTLLFVVGGTSLINLLSDDEGVRQTASTYMPWVVAIPLVSFAAFTWDGIFIGATATRAMLLGMAVATALYFAVYLLLTPIWGNNALWLAFLTYLAARSVAMTILNPLN